MPPGSVDRLFVSKPVLGRVSRKWSIQLTRRIDRPDGSFGGVVVVSLSPDYLTRFYQEVNLGRHGAITLVGYDGIVRARATHGESNGAQDLSDSSLFKRALLNKEGTWRARSHIDGVDRLWAYRALDDDRLLVFTGESVDEITAETTQRRNAYLAGAAVLSAVIMAFVAVLMRRARVQADLLEQLERSNEEANTANLMKTRFLASVSHELRTPLNGILGYAELIRDGSGDAESREYACIVHQSAQHLHELVNTILDMAKIESGRMAIRPAPVALRGLLGEVTRLHSVHAHARGCSMRLELAPDCPAQVVTDRARLVQVLNNLLNNAIKFGGHGEIVVAARAEDTRVIVEVRDHGPGIPADQLARIFTRFHATTAEFVHPEQGAGLGLPLSYELVALLGGSLRIDSRPAEGTTVIIDLPVDAASISIFE